MELAAVAGALAAMAGATAATAATAVDEEPAARSGPDSQSRLLGCIRGMRMRWGGWGRSGNCKRPPRL